MEGGTGECEGCQIIGVGDLHSTHQHVGEGYKQE